MLTRSPRGFCVPQSLGRTIQIKSLSLSAASFENCARESAGFFLLQGSAMGMPVRVKVHKTQTRNIDA